ncbi:MAG: MBL fold metallo-hydrolase [Candidatus Fimadaptatus sp.]|jgi:phosphoribosyl 1,2-cyclic phosphodiesterase
MASVKARLNAFSATHALQIYQGDLAMIPIPEILPARRLRLCALASGSKGNCIYVGCGDTHLLIDCGITQRDIAAGLSSMSAHLPAPIAASNLSAILISHEHSDHIRSCAGLARRHLLPVYASAETLAAINSKSSGRGIPNEGMRAISAGQDFYIGDIGITPFKTPHDAACSLGYRLDAGAASVAIATDIGRISDRWLSAIEGAQLVMLEANHDEDMLRAGPYPDSLKRRILSDRGHLSNAACARAAVHLARTGTRVILLSHLSEQNNTPRLAYDTVCAALLSEGIRPGRDIYVGMLAQDHASDIFELECE